MSDITRRDVFKGLLVATASGLVVQPTEGEIQAFGHITEPTPVAVSRTMHQTKGPIGEVVFINLEGRFMPIGVIRDIAWSRDTIDVTTYGDLPFRRFAPGLITLTYEVVASGAAHVKVAESFIRG